MKFRGRVIRKSISVLPTFGKPALSFKNPSAIFLSLDRVLPAKCVFRVEIDPAATRHVKTIVIAARSVE